MLVKSCGFVFILTLAICRGLDTFRERWDWSWRCLDGKCVKTEYSQSQNLEDSVTPENICKLTCGPYGSLWPKPTGETVLSQQVIAFHPSKVKFDFSQVVAARSTRDYLQKGSKLFQNNLYTDCGPDCSLVPDTDVIVSFKVSSSNLRLQWFTNESYNLNVTTTGQTVFVLIQANTAFGARHALETLSQLTSWYSVSTSLRSRQGVLVMVTDARIADNPYYTHRGLVLDTARNFFSVATIQRLLDGMAMAKMNVLHWHATDSQSFPLETPRVPQLSRFGAYSSDHIYTAQDTAFIFEYARNRGVRVIVEIDAPAHVGNGWQWGESAGYGKLAVCVNEQPWRKFCIQPPCGQLNPANPKIYDVLRDLYKDILDFIPPGEVFHMGGDEVFFPCWNASEEILSWMEDQGLGTNESDFVQVWGDFQASALKVFDEENVVPDAPIMLWSSHLTDPEVIDRFLPKERYVIQTWVEASDPVPNALLSKGYKLVIATKDTWYLDHGFWGKTVYHNWRVAYDNRLPQHDNVLGGEAAMWAELVDDHSIDVKVWPRTAAVAERLWTNPSTSSYEAESRIQEFRQRLIKRGMHPDSLAPNYCYQNDGDCQ